MATLEADCLSPPTGGESEKKRLQSLRIDKSGESSNIVS